MTRRESLLARIAAQAEGMTDEALDRLAWQAAMICRCGDMMTRRSSKATEGGLWVYLRCPGCGARKSRLLYGYNIKSRTGKRKGTKIESSKTATTRRRTGDGTCR